jgi:hypothetical protein
MYNIVISTERLLCGGLPMEELFELGANESSAVEQMC